MDMPVGSQVVGKGCTCCASTRPTPMALDLNHHPSSDLLQLLLTLQIQPGWSRMSGSRPEPGMSLTPLFKSARGRIKAGRRYGLNPCTAITFIHDLYLDPESRIQMPRSKYTVPKISTQLLPVLKFPEALENSISVHAMKHLCLNRAEQLHIQKGSRD